MQNSPGPQSDLFRMNILYTCDTINNGNDAFFFFFFFFWLATLQIQDVNTPYTYL